MRLAGATQRPNRKQEDTGIPKETSGRQHIARSASPWLFYETGKRLRTECREVGAFRKFEIPIACFRPGGRNTEGYEIPLEGLFCSCGNGGSKRVRIRNNVVGRRHEHQCIRIGLLKVEGRGQNGRCSVAPLWLDQNGLGGLFDPCKLFRHNETKRITRDHQGSFEPYARQPASGGLEQTFVAQ
ncbi:hypothetical protein EV656_1228 [Rhodovulum adriaticum]|uniref:Uncharacterized protein n=1 Tax=Rhodovulum adriaticum TaxID=35804 RepID=A0A4R2NG87_RHOAD|nr:hypothetical protein EV656_1228 [Rhodovulum adriaticum]